MNRLPPLNALVAFRAVMETGSLVAAASKLAITASAVSHRLKALEDHLGLELFERRSRAVFPTAAAHRYAAEISDAFDRIAAATKAVETVGNRDTLTIFCPPSLAELWLMKRVRQFAAANEGLTTVVSCLSEKSVKLDNGQYDVYFLPKQDLEEGYETLSLGRAKVRPLISPVLLERLGYPRKPQELMELPTIMSVDAPMSWETWLAHAGVQDAVMKEVMVSDSSSFAINAAIAGDGIVLESSLFSADAEAGGQLVPLFPEHQQEGVSFDMIWREKRRDEEKISKFCNWLERQMELGSDPKVTAGKNLKELVGA
ncbi:LysR substrate-binding domain-containing protein [Polycladidibacter stylochi]|uniref:LysR substrate-binding domain-containing protein n=1 Tax=Polycladidibacter stylochi TaxID=1807766 RepID=UPI0009E8CFBD|nr:LysR substrate-binding domain-containing protein [Pseudovibrio stylochi]